MKSISQHLSEFARNGNPYFLVCAVRSIFREGRFIELLYGIACFLVPKRIAPKLNLLEEPEVMKSIPNLISRLENRDTKWILEKYPSYEKNIKKLPKDFNCARSSAVLEVKNHLIIGEYGWPGARIAIITHNNFQLVNYYNSIQGVRHIHAICTTQESSNTSQDISILITTGDTVKRLDEWVLCSFNQCFSLKKTLKKRLAGYTSMVAVNNKIFCGTDFSSRPNFIIENNSGKIYWFPKQCSNMYTVDMIAISGNQILCLNKKLAAFGDNIAISVFDTYKMRFTSTVIVTTSELQKYMTTLDEQ